MTTPALLDKESLNTALKYIWGQYRAWDLTSVALKNRLARWRDVVLVLSISGAILGTLCQQVDDWRIAALPTWLAATLGVLSGAALGLAAYFTKEVLSPEPEAAALRTRAAAEAFKREAYLLATGVPPYADASTTDELLEKAKQIRASVENIAPVTISSAQQEDGMLPAAMSVDDYVKQRVDQQVDEYYLPQARINVQKLALGRRISFVLGAIAVLLGLWSARSASVAGWVAVIGTITAGIAARQYAGRYQFLIVSYQATADRLQWLKTKWELEGRNLAGDDAKHAFIVAAEDAIATENSAWMAEWSRKQGD